MQTHLSTLTDLLPPPCVAELYKHYGEPHRAYHNLSHLLAVLATAETMRPLAQDWPAIQMALCFHDIIYNPRANDNEAQSAAVARHWLAQMGWADGRIAVVEAHIMATQHHQPTTADGQLLVDADLAILAAEPAAYDDYARAIRAEYEWVAGEAYRHGRTRVLQNFLARPHIYHTPLWRETAEPRARQNLAREITILSA
jgi:predicted metal-dependent HD superfamily phosphohydrolase